MRPFIIRLLSCAFMIIVLCGCSLCHLKFKGIPIYGSSSFQKGLLNKEYVYNSSYDRYEGYLYNDEIRVQLCKTAISNSVYQIFVEFADNEINFTIDDFKKYIELYSQKYGEPIARYLGSSQDIDFLKLFMLEDNPSMGSPISTTRIEELILVKKGYYCITYKTFHGKIRLLFNAPSYFTTRYSLKIIYQDKVGYKKYKRELKKYKHDEI